jgi:hypothetical protein
MMKRLDEKFAIPTPPPTGETKPKTGNPADEQKPAVEVQHFARKE